MGYGGGAYGGIAWGDGAGASPPPPSLDAGLIAPASDTIFGGADVVLATEHTLLDTQYDTSFLALTFPALWAAASGGSGSARPTLEGVVVDTGLTAASIGGVQSTVNFTSYDLSVGVESLFPAGPTASAIDLAIIEISSGADTARVRLRRGVGSDLSVTAGFGDFTVAGRTWIGGTVVASPRATLRFVRNTSRIFGFVNDVQVLDANIFSSASGPIRLRVANATLATRVRSRFTNFTLQSACTIDGRLLNDMSVVGPRRLIGTVPETAIDRRGLRDVAFFGLFGSVTLPAAFTYTLPAAKTVGRTATQLLQLFQRNVRD